MRGDVHKAFDELAPSTRGLAERVVDATVSQHRIRRMRPRWEARHFDAIALVAIFTMILMIGLALVGGRIWDDWNALNANPARGIDKAELDELEARPLQLPVLAPNAECPVGPFGSYIGYGGGPVYIIGGLFMGAHPTTDASPRYEQALAYTDAGLRGLVIGRARDLKTGQPFEFIGEHAAGPVGGTERIDGKLYQRHPEVLLDTNHPPRTTIDDGKLVVWGMQVRIPTGTSGCTAFQFDGPNFTEVIVTGPAGWGIG